MHRDGGPATTKNRRPNQTPERQRSFCLSVKHEHLERFSDHRTFGSDGHLCRDRLTGRGTRDGNLFDACRGHSSQSASSTDGRRIQVLGSHINRIRGHSQYHSLKDRQTAQSRAMPGRIERYDFEADVVPFPNPSLASAFVRSDFQSMNRARSSRPETLTVETSLLTVLILFAM
jgi:hypothetical protein